MPQSRRNSKVNTRKNPVIQTKFKIGGRKSNVSAIGLSNKDLLKSYENTGRGRDKPKLRQIALKRGLAL